MGNPPLSLPADSPARGQQVWFLLIYGLIFFALLERTFAEILDGGEALPGDPAGCLASYFYFARRFLGEALRHGEFPLWDPYLMAGLPFAGSIQNAAFYPWNWLGAVVPPAWMIALTLWAHLVLAAWSMDRLCRRLGCSWPGAVFGGLTYGLSGFGAAHLYAGRLNDLCALAWAPLILVEFERATIPGAKRHAARGGLLFGVQILAGAPGISALTAVALALLAAGRIATNRAAAPGTRGRMKPVEILAGFLIVGLGVAAVQILPALSFWWGSCRGGAFHAGAASPASVRPENLAQLVFPHFFGRMNDNSGWGAAGRLWEAFGFLGVLALGAAAVSWGLGGPQRATARLYSAIAALGLVLAMGDWTPVHGLLRLLIPFLGDQRAPASFLFLWTLCLPPAAGLGWDALVSGDPARAELRRTAIRRLLKAACLLAFAFGAFFAAKGAESDPWRRLLAYESQAAQSLPGHEDERAPLPESHSDRLETFQGAKSDATFVFAILFVALGAFFLGSKAKPANAMAFGALALALHGLDLLRVAWGLAEPHPMKPNLWDANMAALIRDAGGRVAAASGDSLQARPTDANQGLIHRIPMVWGDVFQTPERFSDLVLASQGLPSGGLYPFLSVHRMGGIPNLLGLRWLITPPESGANRPDWRLAWDEGWFTAYENTKAKPRAWIAPACQNLKSWEAILLALASESVDPLQTVLLEHAPPGASGTATQRGSASQPGEAGASVPAPASEASQPAGENTPEAKIVEDRLTRVAVDFRAPRGGFLVLADRWDSGCEARLNGQSVPLLRAFGVLRAVEVPQGNGRVDFVYRPWPIAAGALICLGMLAALAASGWRIRSSRR